MVLPMRWLPLLMVTILLVGCGGKQMNVLSCAGKILKFGKVQEQGQALQDGEDITPVTVADPIGEAEIRAFIDRWLATQNDGRFQDYQSLYATRMTGIRRTGAITKYMNNAGWMVDRGKMFQKKMVVEITDLKVLSATSAFAMVEFVQTFSTGTFRDVGPKQIIVVRENGVLKVSREEMLSSDVGSQHRSPLKLLDWKWMPVETLDGPVVLLDDAPTVKTGAGRARLLSDEYPVVAVQDANAEMLDARLSGMKERKVVLYGPRGEVCRGTLGTISIYSRHLPHFGTREMWAGEDRTSPTSRSAIAAEAMSIDMGRVFGAKVNPEPGQNCAGATWARDAALDAPILYQRDFVPESLKSLGRSKLRGLRGYVAATKEVGTAWEGEGHFDLFTDPTGGRRFLTMWAQFGYGCGDPSASLWAIWEVIEDGNGPGLVLMTDERDPGSLFVPEAAADVDGDGAPEFFAPQTMVRQAGPILAPLEMYSIPDFDCPC